MIKGEFIGREHLGPYVRKLGMQVIAEVEKSINILCIKLLRKVKEEKLSGKPLKNRTGTLRRSVNYRVEKSQTGLMFSIKGIVGTNKEYAAAHEYGFDGQVTVKEHLRLIKKAFGVSLKEPKQITVGSHTRHMRLPERSFLRSALREMESEIQSEIDNAIKRATSK